MEVIEEFIAPSFLQNQGKEEIHKRMLERMPADIDKGEGGFPWDFTVGTAIEKSEMVEYVLTEAIKSIFPQWSYGKMLDYHATSRGGMKRKSAIKAAVTITVTGTKGTEIPKGSKFSTEATEDTPSIEFATNKSAIIPESGTIDIDCEAVIGGENGNVVAGSIKLPSKPIDGVKSVFNALAATGGMNEETDSGLKNRIVEFDRNQENSFVGSVQDYKRWAESVDGVGQANVVPPTNDTEVITIRITDAKGQPAAEEICTNVYNYIMSPEYPAERLAAINAQISVVPSQSLAITIAATIQIADGYTIENIKETFIEKSVALLGQAEGKLYYNRVVGALSGTPGVIDFGNTLKVNGGAADIDIPAGYIPTISADEVVFTIG